MELNNERSRWRLQKNVPRRHSLHEVGMLQRSAQIVSTQSLPPEMGARFRFLGKPAVALCRLAGSAPHKSGCNYTHWVHLKCTQMKQRQYKPEWRCTIHTPTQNVTTPSTAQILDLHKLCQHNPCPQRWGPDSVFWASRSSLSAAWLALLLTKADVTTHTTHTGFI